MKSITKKELIDALHIYENSDEITVWIDGQIVKLVGLDDKQEGENMAVLFIELR